jgi:hypothetical protein
MLNINLMCPQNKSNCSLVPIGILPLLPASDSNCSSGTTSPGANPPTRAKPAQVLQTSPLSRHLSAQNQRFVGLLDDDLASMASSTPPPSSPSTCDHSPVMLQKGGTPLPLIATDEEGQLIFNFSTSDDYLDSSQAMADDYNRRHNRKSNDVSMEVSSPTGGPTLAFKAHGPKPKMQCDAIHDKSRHETVGPPFPVPPSQSSHQMNNAALTLTPSFFSLAPQPATASSPLKPENSTSSTLSSSSSSPFPFAPPVPSMPGLPGLPQLPALPQKSDTSTSSSSIKNATPTPSTLGSPTSPTIKQHQRSTSSSSSNSPTSPQATPHASPTTFVPLHAHMKSQRSPTPTNHSQMTGHHHLGNIPGPLSALQQSKLQGGHPRSPQLAGLPSPSLVPPSPLSLYPPGVDHSSALTSVQSANPGGFFGARKSSSATAASHVKKISMSNATSAAVGKPSSPVIKPLKS